MLSVRNCRSYMLISRGIANSRDPRANTRVVTGEACSRGIGCFVRASEDFGWFSSFGLSLCATQRWSCPRLHTLSNLGELRIAMLLMGVLF